MASGRTTTSSLEGFKLSGLSNSKSQSIQILCSRAPKKTQRLSALRKGLTGCHVLHIYNMFCKTILRTYITCHAKSVTTYLRALRCDALLQLAARVECCDASGTNLLKLSSSDDTSRDHTVGPLDCRYPYLLGILTMSSPRQFCFGNVKISLLLHIP